MSSMNTDYDDVEKVTYFVLHVIYNCPKREMSPGDIEKAKKKKVCTYKTTAARSKVLNYENIASTFS